MVVVRPLGSTAERKIARIAQGAHGVVTRAELTAAGLTPAEIKHRVAIGTLLREHRGVYRVGHRAPSVQARYVAAVVACGREAALSGAAATHLLGLLRGAAPPPEVTVVGRRRLLGVTTVRTRRLDPRDVTRWEGVPVTSVARTVVDMAARLTLDQLARLCHEAGVRHRTTPRDIEAALMRRSNATGSANLRRVIRGDVHLTLSWLEDRFLALLRRERLALPLTNRPAGARHVDCRWPGQRLTVELDSYRYHHSRHAWELDRRREREARARGDDFRRYTYGDVIEDPRAMLAELRFLIPVGCATP